MGTSAKEDYTIVNKKNGRLKIQQLYVVLPVYKDQITTGTITCEPVYVEKDAEVIVEDSLVYDECYERLLIITKLDSVPEEILTHSLVGFPNEEKVYIIPIVAEPYMDLEGESAYELQLMLQGADSSHEAMQLLHEQNDQALISLTHEFQSVYKSAPEETKQIPDPTVAPTPANLMPNSFSPFFKISGAFASVLSKLPFLTVDSTEIPLRFWTKDAPLHEKELLARSARLKTITKTLGDNAPTIGISTSGGGMRAMISSCGFFSGLKEIGVLDIALYQCALSGSTWSTTSWMTNKVNPFVSYDGKHVDDCWSSDISHQGLGAPNIDKLIDLATHDIFSWENFKKYLPMLIKTKSFLLIYSKMLGEKLNATEANYKEWESKALSGKYPIALCTSVFKHSDPKTPFPVVDHTPFDIGSPFLGTFYTQDYYQLENFDHPLPIGLNNFMAVWGSAFYANLAQIIPDMPEVISSRIGTLSASGAKVLNANYNRKDPATGALLPLANQRFLYFRDGGVLANVPVAPLLRPERTVELIIAMDCSASVAEKPFNELLKALPEIEPAIPKNPTYPYVFPKTEFYPTIVYIPILRDSNFDRHFDPADCGSFEFTYSKENAQKLHDLVHFHVIKAKDTIWNVINSLKEEKNQMTTQPTVPEENIKSEIIETQEEPKQSTRPSSSISNPQQNNSFFSNIFSCCTPKSKNRPQTPKQVVVQPHS